MKLQLDTDAKTIKIEGTVKLKKLVETLEKLLPKGLWKEFELENNTKIVGWTNPIIVEKIIERNPCPTYPSYPWIAYCDTHDAKVEILCASDLNSGTFNVECQS